MVSKHFTAGFKYNDLQETQTDILHPVTPIWGISVIYWTFEHSVRPWCWLVCLSVRMLHTKSCLGGDTVAMCDMRKWGDLICVPIYNEADTVYMVFFTDTPLSCLYSVLSVAIHWDKTDTNDGREPQGPQGGHFLLERNHWKDITNVGVWESAGKVRSLSPPQCAQRVRISQNIHTRSKS